MSKSNLSRRSLVSSAVAMPALTVPAFAFDHPDAELLRLGGHLAVVEREWEAMVVEGHRRSEIYDAACKHAGLDPDRNYDEFETYDQFIEYGHRLQALWPESDSKFDDEDEMSAFNHRLHDLIEKILSMKATTVAGVAVQTRAIVLDNAEYWSRCLLEEEENDPVRRRQRQFLEAMCRFLGLQPAAIRLRWNV